MAAITIYIVDDSNRYSHGRSGDIDTIMETVELLKEKYTLQRPPDTLLPWYWIDSKWTTDDTAN